MRTVVIIVTFNRLNDLKKTLDAYEKQTICPEQLIVINNCSTDGTTEFLLKWQSESGHFIRKVFNLSENVGGSGGFSYGMKEALTTDTEWVFVADDDAVPRFDVFEKMEQFIGKHPEIINNSAAICTSVYNKDHYSIKLAK